MVGVVGHMSGGKSYFAVERMLGLMYNNHIVVSNIKLNCQAVTTYLNTPCIFWKQLYYYLEDGPATGYHVLDLRDYNSYPCGSPRGSATYDQDMVFVFLDEASSIFDSMVHASDGGINAVATWARHTRKRGIEVVLLMQFATELHKRLRIHILEYISCVNSDTLKLPLLGVGLPFFLRGLSIRQRYASDLETRIGDAKWQRYRPEIYRCYNTAQIVVGHSSVELQERPRVDYSASILAASQQRLALVSSVVIVFTILLGVWLVCKVIGS